MTGYSASEISNFLAGRVEILCRELLPEGKRVGAEWCVGSIYGEAGQSLRVHLTGEKAGLWADFNGSDEKGDLLDLWCRVRRVRFAEALREAQEWLGIGEDAVKAKSRKRASEAPHRVQRPNSANRSNGRAKPNTAPPDHHPQLGEPTFCHEYTDAAGKNIMWHCRFDPPGYPKEFRPLSWSGRKWIWKDPPESPLPLYHQADLANRPTAPVLLVEGEKAADHAPEVLPNYVTTTWPHGAKAVENVDFSPLKGRVVTAWPDNDESGHKCMKKAAELVALAGAARVHLVDPPKALPPKWDLADELPEGWDENAVAEMVASAREVAGGIKDISQCSVGRWIGREPEPLVFTIENLVPEGMVTLLSADGGTGKTSAGQMACSCVAAGIPLWGRETLQGAAAGIFAEDPERVIHLRQTRINRALELEMEAMPTKLFLQSYFGQDAMLWQDGKPAPFFGQIEDQLSKIHDLRLVFIDNAALVYGDNENDRMLVTRFVSALNGLATRLRIAVILTTHTSKTSSDESRNVASGSTAWVNACRSVLTLKASRDDSATLGLAKANHSKPGLTIDLQWRNGVLTQQEEPTDIERRTRQRELDQLIFNLVHAAATKKAHLSSAPQAKDRYLPAKVARTSQFKLKDVEATLLTWMDSGHIEQVSLPGRKRGLGIAKWPDHLETVEREVAS